MKDFSTVIKLLKEGKTMSRGVNLKYKIVKDQLLFSTRHENDWKPSETTLTDFLMFGDDWTEYVEQKKTLFIHTVDRKCENIDAREIEILAPTSLTFSQFKEEYYLKDITLLNTKEVETDI